MARELPYPPLELANRVGSLADAADPFAWYDEIGRRSRDSLLELLPPDWSFEGKRVLDFGCGAGRTLRHLTAEAEVAEFWGCDIDRESIEWLEQELAPPFRFFRNEPEPPLPFADASVDLVYAVSVFTHLTNTWSSWLLELHRILVPEGILIATFIGPGATPSVTTEAWDETTVGMNVLRPGQPWDEGGPIVLHSSWWLRAHWGRAFDIAQIRLSGFAADEGSGQGAIAMRKRAAATTPRELEAPAPNESREYLAAAENVRQLAREAVALRKENKRLASAAAAHADATKAADELRAHVDRIAASASWRWTAPLRLAAERTRRLRSGKRRQP